MKGCVSTLSTLSSTLQLLPIVMPVVPKDMIVEAARIGVETMSFSILIKAISPNILKLGG